MWVTRTSLYVTEGISSISIYTFMCTSLLPCTQKEMHSQCPLKHMSYPSAQRKFSSKHSYLGDARAHHLDQDGDGISSHVLILDDGT